jgi:hypothetical protein
MQRLEVSGAVRHIYMSLRVKGLRPSDVMLRQLLQLRQLVHRYLTANLFTNKSTGSVLTLPTAQVGRAGLVLSN